MSQCWMYSKHWESITQNFSSCKQSFITKIHQYSHEYYINIFDVVNDIFVCFQSNHVLDWVTNRVTNVCQLSDGVSLDKTCYTIVIICLQNNLILISPAEAKLIKDTRQHQIMDDSMMKVLLTGGDRSLLWHSDLCYQTRNQNCVQPTTSLSPPTRAGAGAAFNYWLSWPNSDNF